MNEEFRRIQEMNNSARLDKMSSERLGDYGVYDGGLLVEAQASPNMTVKVSAGVCYMPTTFQRYDISATASLAVTAADATNPRYDIVYVSSAGVVSYLAGTAAASPSVPATPSGAVKLAEIYVTAGKTSIVSGDIILRRWFLNSGGWTTWTPTITWPTNTPTGIITTARYKKIGKTILFTISISCDDGNGSTGTVYITLPETPKANNSFNTCAASQVIGSSPNTKFGNVRDNGANNDLSIGISTATALSALKLRCAGFYEIA